MYSNCSKTIDILWVDSYTERVKEYQEEHLTGRQGAFLMQ